MSATLPAKELEDLLHDINAACTNLRDGASLLKTATPQESRELLALMENRAQRLFQRIAQARQNLA